MRVLNLQIFAFLLSLAFAMGAYAEPKEKAKVAILLFPGVELLDFAGPGEAFATASNAEGDRLFDVFTVGLTKEPIKSQGFLTVTPRYDTSDAPLPDVLVIPGGNVIPVMDDPKAMAWIEGLAKKKTLLFSVCNGATILGKAGLLDGLESATHHGNRDILKAIAPKTICLKDRRFIDNGKIITSAGVSAGIDGALYLIGRLKGTDVAKRTATAMEFDYWFGFDEKKASLTKTKAGAISQMGRIHESERTWAVMLLLATLRDKGFQEAVQAYPMLLEGAKGHDREMIAEEGLCETAEWLVKHSRDKNLGLDLFKVVVATNPKSAKAHTALGKAWLDCGKPMEAKKALEKALEIDPNLENAKNLLKDIP